MTNTPKPAILFFGNCQAQFLAAAVKYSGIGDAYYIGGDWGFVQSYHGCLADSLAPDIAPQWVTETHAAGKRVILATQVGPMRNSRYVLHVDPAAADRQVLFPTTALWSMPRAGFLEVFKAPYSLERMEELTREANEAAQEKSNFPIDMARFIAEESRTRPLFNIGAHPNGEVYSLLLNGLAELLAEEVDCTPLLRIGGSCASEDVLNYLTDHPVDLELRKAFGWHWGPEYEIFAEMLRSSSDKRWDDFERELPHYEALFSGRAGGTQFWRCSALFGTERRDDAIALPALEKLLELCPGIAGPWMLYARYLAFTSTAAKIEALLRRAEKILGEGTAIFDVISEKVQRPLQFARNKAG